MLSVFDILRKGHHVVATTDVSFMYADATDNQVLPKCKAHASSMGLISSIGPRQVLFKSTMFHTDLSSLAVNRN